MVSSICPRSDESPVQRDDFSHGHPLQVQDFPLFVLGEAAIFLAQRGQTRILLDGAVSEPGEIVPHLQIQQLLCGKLAGDAVEIMPGDVQSPFHQQLMVSWEGSHHRRPIGRKKMTDQKGLFFEGQIGRWALGMFEKKIEDLAGADFLELQEERRGKIECGANSRKFFQQIGHIVVGLGRMQAYPRHAGRSGHRIGVVGLVHMPQETHMDMLHRCRLPFRSASMS